METVIFENFELVSTIFYPHPKAGKEIVALGLKITLK